MGLKLQGEINAWNPGLLGAAVYCSLHTANPTSSNELSGNAYARVSVASTGWTVNSTNGTASNTAAITFPAATGTWGDPTHVALFDASTSGNMLISGALSNNIAAPGSGSTVSFAAGQLTITMTTD